MFLACMFSHSFLPFISQPTRITSHTATLIDNIFTNHLPYAAINGIFFTDVSDHLPIFTFLSQDKPISSRTRVIRRVINTQNMTGFRMNMKSLTETISVSTMIPTKPVIGLFLNIMKFITYVFLSP